MKLSLQFGVCKTEYRKKKIEVEELDDNFAGNVGRDESLSLFSLVNTTYTLECVHLRIDICGRWLRSGTWSHFHPQIQQIHKQNNFHRTLIECW